MDNLMLSQGQFKIIADLLIIDIQDLANNPEFFEECDYNPKDYIDERIELCELFKIDFWNTVDLFCNHYTFQRLKALYDGHTVEEFNERYEIPSQPEIELGFLKALSKGKQNLKKQTE